MSVWRLEIDMAFKKQDDMEAFLNLIESLSDKLADKLEGSLAIHRKVRYHECMHDVGGPCSNYTNIDFTGAVDHGVAADVIVPEPVKVEIKREVVLENDTLKADKVILEEENAALVADIAKLKNPTP